MTVQSETGYHGLKEGQDHKNWKGMKADYHDGKERGEVLVIDGHPVMEEWEKPYMEALAKVATSKGGKVLEVGFGLGLSASEVQRNKIDEHLIIEANAGVVERGKEWAKSQPNKVTFLEGLWQDKVAELPDNSLDGVLYDTYPLTKEEQHTHQFDFIGKIYPKLKPGGILTYCNLTSIGVLKGQHEKWRDLWFETQVPHIKRCGFDEFKYTTCKVTAPDSCDYYAGHKEALVPKLTKRMLKKPRFIKLEKIQPDTRGINVTVKVLEAPETKVEREKDDGTGTFKVADVKVGDSSACITISARDAQIDLCKQGATLIVRNARAAMIKGHIRLQADKWGKIEVSTEAFEGEINTKKDISAAEYELVGK